MVSKIILHHCALDESSLSIGRVKAHRGVELSELLICLNHVYLHPMVTQSVKHISLHIRNLSQYVGSLWSESYCITGKFSVVFNLAFFGECPSTPKSRSHKNMST